MSKFRPALTIKWAAFMLVVFLFAGYGVNRFEQKTLIDDYFDVRRQELNRVAQKVDGLVNSISDASSLSEEQTKALDAIAGFQSLRLVVSDLNGRVLYDSTPVQVMVGQVLDRGNELQISPKNSSPRLKIWTTKETTPVYLEKSEARNFVGNFDDVSINYFAPLKDGSGKLAGQLLIVEKMERLDKTMIKLRENTALFLSIWFGIAVIGCHALVTLTITRPLKKLAGVCDQAGRRNFQERVEFNTGDEIAVLGTRFNTMSYNLEKIIREIEERNEGLVHLSSELETRNQELNRRQRAIEFDLKLAHRIQQELLPQVYPKIEGILISAANFQVGEIGGDCFDFYKLTDTRLGAFIGDVSGKGISAALVMSMVTILFSQLKEQFTSPSEILGKVNDIMFRHFGSQHSIYLTCFFITVDTANREIIFSCAGHNPPFLFRPRTGEVIELEAEGFGLGMFNAVTYEEKRMSVESGDKIIFYTDGVVDSRNAEGAMFGYERLVQMVKENPTANSYRLTHFLVEELEEFAGSVPRADDLTLLILEVDLDKNKK